MPPRWARRIAAFAAFQISNSTGGAVYLMRAERDVILGYGVYDPSVRVSPQIYDLVLAVGCNLIAELTAGRGRPRGNPAVAVGAGRSGPLSAAWPLPGPLRPEPDGPAAHARQPGLPAAGGRCDLHEQARAGLVSALEGSRRDMGGQVRHLLRPLLLMGTGRDGGCGRAAGPAPPRPEAAASAGGHDASRRSRTRCAMPPRASC